MSLFKKRKSKKVNKREKIINIVVIIFAFVVLASYFLIIFSNGDSLKRVTVYRNKKVEVKTSFCNDAGLDTCFSSCAEIQDGKMRLGQFSLNKDQVPPTLNAEYPIKGSGSVARCVDTDCDDAFTKGSLDINTKDIIINGLGDTSGTIEDFCFPIGGDKDGFLAEFTCGQPSYQASEYEQYNNIFLNTIECVHGCENGACLKVSTSTMEDGSEPPCFDTDGGWNLYNKGYVIMTETGKRWKDFCQDGYEYEFMCYPGKGCGGLSQKRFICPKGCDKGACLK